MRVAKCGPSQRLRKFEGPKKTFAMNNVPTTVKHGREVASITPQGRVTYRAIALAEHTSNKNVAHTIHISSVQRGLRTLNWQ